MKRRLIAGFLTLCMIVSLCPPSAFAVHSSASEMTEPETVVTEPAADTGAPEETAAPDPVPSEPQKEAEPTQPEETLPEGTLPGGTLPAQTQPAQTQPAGALPEGEEYSYRSISVGQTVTLTAGLAEGGSWTSDNLAAATVTAAEGDTLNALVYGVAAGVTTVTYAVDGAEERWVVYVNDPAVQTGETTGETVAAEAPADSEQATVEDQPQGGSVLDKLGGLLTGAADTQAAAASIKADKTTITVGESITLSGTPNTYGGCSYGSWSVDDASIASITPTGGELTGKAAGIVTVTHKYCSQSGWHSAYLYGHKEETETLAITVKAPDLTSVTISGEDTVIVGVPTQLTATAQPAGAEMNLTWESSDADTLTVTETGLITGVKAGNATITVTDASTGVIATYNVTVRNVVPVESVTLTGVDDNTMTAFTDANLTATVEPTNADVVGHEWESSSEEILTVDQNGHVTAVAPGEAEIRYTVTTKDGTRFTATKKITVTAPESYTDSALFYYLIDPDGDPKSNTAGWGTTLGEGTVNMESAQWQDSEKNCYGVSGRIISWPSGFNNGDIPRGGSHWTAIFDAYKSKVEKDLGVKITEDDVEYIRVHPFKISRNNASNPDKHVDCTVEVKTKSVYTAVYKLWDTGDTGYVQQAAKNYKAGATTDPSEFTSIDNLPTTKDANGVTYTFDGWYTNETRTGSKVTFPYTLNANTTFYAKYVAGYYVTYNLNGGQWNQGQTSFRKNEGSIVSIISEKPTLSGYTFKGWTSAEITEDQIKAGTFTMPAKNVTLTAQWEKSTFNLTVNYVYEDGSEAATTHTETVDFEKNYRVPSPSITGYTPNEEVVSGTMPAEDVTVTVTYTANSYKVTYNYGTAPAGASALPAVETRKYNESVKVAPAATAPGYTFKGWTTDDVTVSADGTFTMPAKDVTLTGEWEVINYTVIYENYNGTEISYKDDYHYGDVVTVPADPTREPDATYTYEFAGWVKKDGTALDNGKCVGNVTYMATYTQIYINYTVTYTDGVDGEVVFANRDHYNLHFGDTTPVFGTDPVRTGYTFMGWNPEVSATVTGTVTYVARWEKDESQIKEVRYTVEHKVEGVVKKSDTYTESVWVNDPNEITVRGGTLARQNYTGYKFASMTPETTEGSKVASDSVIILNYVKDDSQTQPTKYTVRYTINGNERESFDVTGTAWINDNPAMIAIAADGIPAPEDKFQGYKLDPANPTYPAPGTQVKSGSVYTVNYVARNDTAYKVEHYQQNLADDEYTLANTDKMSGTTGELTAAVARSYPGFTAQSFNQMTIAADGSTVVKIYYNRNTYTVTYTDGVTDETLFEDQVTGNVRYGTATPAFGGIPTRTGYVFAGWDPTVAGTVTADATYTAKWNPATGTAYTVRHYQQNLEGDGYALTDTDNMNGTTGEQTAAVARSYSGFTAKSFNQKPIAADGSTVVDIYYTRNSYKVTYAYADPIPAGASKLPDEATYKYGTSVTVAAPATATGYTFSGWSRTGSFDMPAEDVTITGSFTVRSDLSYTVNYLEKGTNSVLHAQKVQNGMTFGTTVAAKDEVIAIEGYTYDSTDKENLTITTDENVINLYYTKRTDLTATVNYYWNGTTTKVHESETVTGLTFQQTLNKSPISVAGRTPVSDASQTITIGTGGNVINFYYYKNVELTANSKTGTYNGAGQTVEGYTGAPADADFSGITVSASGTNAGTYDAKFADGTVNTVDATGKYIVTKATDGTLTINKRTVTLTSGSANKQYDGTELTKHEVTVGGEGFANGEGAAYNYTGSQTTVGKSDNTFTYTLNEGTGEGNYDITVHYGELEVTNRTDKYTINVEANSGEKTYDGIKLTVDGFKTLSFAVEGNTYTVEGLTAHAEGTNVSDSKTVTVTGTPVVKDAAGNDVTAQFTVNTKPGTLTINPVAIELTAASDSKTYDGTALTKNGYTITSGEFVGEEGLASVTVEGSQTLVGSSSNAITGYALKDNTAANDYTITTKPGTLTVTDRGEGEKYAITVNAKSDSKTYDGTKLTVDGFETLSFAVEGNTYTVEGLTAHAEGTNVSDSKTVPVTGTAIVKDAAGNDVTAQFTVTTKDGTLTIKKRTVTLTSESAHKEYDGTPLTRPDVTMTGDGFVTGEVTGIKATGSVTTVAEGKVKNTIVYATGENFNADNYTITEVLGELYIETNSKTITITANSAEKTYDGTALTDSGYTYTEGVLAEGDVLTATVEGSITNFGNADNVVTGYKVTRNGVDVTDNYNFGESGKGTLTIKKRTVTLTSETASKVYDGTPLTRPNVTVAGDGFVEGEATDIRATGSILNAVDSPVTNTITFTPGADFNADNYIVTKSEGTLTITPVTEKIVVTVTGHTDTAVYDGTAHTVTGYDVAVSNPLYTAADFAFDGTASVTGTDAGGYPMGLAESQFRNVSGNFTEVSFVVNDGGLTVDKRPVTLSSVTDSKVYDRTPLTRSDVTVGGMGFVSGEVTDIRATGSVLNVSEGTVPNPIEFTPAASYKAGNYTIEYHVGTLSVTPAARATVVVTGKTATFVYDGQPHTVTGFTNDGRSRDITVTLLRAGADSAAGTDINRYYMGLTAADFIASSPNYRKVDVEVVDGYLDIVTVNVNVTITVRGNRDTVTYDGSEHSVTGYEIVSVTTNVGRNVTMNGLTLKLRGTASATGTEPGTYPMGLTAADFDVDTTIYRGVRVVVEDGELVIEPETVPETEPTETIPDESVPMGQPDDIPDEDVPMAAPAWALLNLILSLLTVLGSLFLLSGLFGKKKEEATDENGNLILDDNGESVMNRIKQRTGWWITSLLPAIGSVIAFILTENMRNPMVLVDRWTLLMVIIAVIQVLVMMLSKKKVEETEEA